MSLVRPAAIAAAGLIGLLGLIWLVGGFPPPCLTVRPVLPASRSSCGAGR